MRPLKVTATLNESIAGDVPMLDALIERQMSIHRSVAERLHLHHNDPERPDYTPGLIPSPILRRHVAGFAWPIPLCSAPVFRARSDTHDHYARRYDVGPELAAPDQRRVYANNSGELKSYRLPLRVRLIERIVWFCCALDARGVKEIKQAVRRVDYLGKKTSQGYGRVASWTVEDVAEDWSWFAPSPAGPVLMRPMPLAAVPAEAVGHRRSFGGVVPPYWASPYFAEMVVPC